MVLNQSPSTQQCSVLSVHSRKGGTDQECCSWVWVLNSSPYSSVRWPCAVKRCPCRSLRTELWGVQQCPLLFLLLWHTPGKSSGRKGCLGLVLCGCRYSLSWWSALQQELKAAGHIASAVRKQQDGHRCSAHFLLLTKSKTHGKDGSPPKLAQSRNSLRTSRGLPPRWSESYQIDSVYIWGLRVQLHGRTFAWTLGSLLSFTQKRMYFLIFSKFCYVRVCGRMCECVWRPKKGSLELESQVVVSCQCGCWKPNSDPLRIANTQPRSCCCYVFVCFMRQEYLQVTLAVLGLNM